MLRCIGEVFRNAWQVLFWWRRMLHAAHIASFPELLWCLLAGTHDVSIYAFCLLPNLPFCTKLEMHQGQRVQLNQNIWLQSNHQMQDQHQLALPKNPTRLPWLLESTSTCTMDQAHAPVEEDPSWSINVELCTSRSERQLWLLILPRLWDKSSMAVDLCTFIPSGKLDWSEKFAFWYFHIIYFPTCVHAE